MDDVSLTAEAGRVTAVLGPNGAGKSTLFGVLAGIVEPDAGECRLDSVARTRWRRADVGHVAGEPFYFERLNGWQTLGFERTMRGISVADEDLRQVLAEWDADGYSGKPLGGLSHGMRKRILMACAFLGDPALVVLDEPLNGLDIQGVLLLKDRIARARQAGCHVLLCSHILDFVQDLADRTYLINQGRIVQQITRGEASLEAAYRSEFMV